MCSPRLVLLAGAVSILDGALFLARPTHAGDSPRWLLGAMWLLAGALWIAAYRIRSRGKVR